MSYDVSVGSESFNYTSNMAQMFKDLGAYPPDWHGMTASDLAHSVSLALHRAVSMTRWTLMEYDAENGWGNWESALEWLWRIRDEAVRTSPKSIVTVSY